MFFILPLWGQAECKNFDAWKKSFREEQKQLGISEKILKNTIDDALYLPQIIKSDRNQPEFTFNFDNYLQKLHSQNRVEKAIKKYKELKPELEILNEKYGVNGEYIIAFWAIETNFGDYQGRLRTKDALATLSCDQRRSVFFAKEYSIFIRLVEEKKLPADASSSWAGAMGHLQFLPNKIEKYSMDGNRDGKIDIFSSRKDAFETAANYLKKEGWKKDVKWGQAVILSQEIKLEITGRENKKTIEEWKKIGVTPLEGESFAHEPNQSAAIITLKSGETFMVYDNFDVIMIWNRSLHYALTVGLLADKIVQNTIIQEEETKKE